MSDPTIGSQSSRQNLGVSAYSKPIGSKHSQGVSSGGEAATNRPAGDTIESKQRLTNFLSKLETTWQLFNRGTREGDNGQGKGKAAFLDEKDLPTPESLKELRARAQSKGPDYLAKGSSGRDGGTAGGPKESPVADQSSPQGPNQKTGRPSAGSEGKPPPSRPGDGGKPSSDSARPGGTWQPAGTPSSRSFLATASLAGARLRTSDASGKPGTPAQAELLSRQPVFSQSLAQVNPRVTQRQVSGQMPVHNAFLDEHHEEEAGTASPLRLLWSGGKKSAAPEKGLLSGQARLKFGGQNQGGKSLGAPLSLQGGASQAVVSARSELAVRFAGKAIHSLLKKLYDEEDVEELDEEKAVSSLGLILRLGGEFTYEHSTRVLDLAMELADEVGIEDKTTRKEIEFGATLRDIGEFDLLLQSGESADSKVGEFSEFLGGQDMLRAGLLHDIGKVNIPPEILYKPGKLTPEEYDLMKMHPIYGEEIVRPIHSLRYLCPTIRGHHERWDGKGYPDGLAGEAIPMAARIISVADVFDALSAERPYKRGMEIQKVRGILAEGRSTHFDPTLVDSFLAIIERRYPEEVSALEVAPDLGLELADSSSSAPPGAS